MSQDQPAAQTTTEVPAPSAGATTFEQLRAHFPFPSIRPAQGKALEVIASSYDDQVPFTAIEAPTGSGKSGMGLAPACWSASIPADGTGAHYLTSQNSLSRQLLQDFGKYGLVQIKGKSNYFCDKHQVNCEDGSLLNGGTSCETCPYRVAKNRYIAGKLGVTNYTYYLTETRFTGQLEPREYLICDEAHNIEREILSMADITVTQHRCDDIGAGRLPRFEVNEDQKAQTWLSKVFMPPLATQLAKLSEEIDRYKESGSDVPVSLQKRFLGLRQLRTNLESYLSEGGSDWLAWSDKEGQLLIRPLTAANYAQRFLFKGSPNVLLMSATILDFATFRRNLGISKDDMRSFALPSEFPASTRRIVYWPVGSMGAKNIDATLPRLAERTAAILTKFADKKGIIHTHSYKIGNYLQNALRSTPHGRRLLTHTGVSGSREKAISDHYELPDPTILLSPSMTEGLDLRGDYGRVNIITKVPYLFLDPYNRMRMERDNKWYQLQAALALVQASGRCNRSEDDYALTLILDSDFGRFLSQNQDILPKWWLDSIEFR